MKCAVVVFPGSNCDHDCRRVLKHALGQDARFVWHKESDLSDFDCVVLPGGFSYGDYLRAGAIARFSPLMEAVGRFAAAGGIVIGICNGFQILCEAGLLPGALLNNASLKFICRDVHLKIERRDTPFTNAVPPGRKALRAPIAHGQGCYFADSRTLAAIEAQEQVLFRYSSEDGSVIAEANPNGSVANIAGVMNAAGNVLGLMPHPERCSEAVLGNEDGRLIFESMIRWIERRRS